MTDRDRLAVKICNATQKTNFACKDAKCVGKGLCAHCYVMADELLANGVIVPPCKVGDIVYAKWEQTGKIDYWCVAQVIHNGANNFSFNACIENEDGYLIDVLDFDYVDIGKTVFLTKEDAENALKERQ